jgi:hypothetical protein
MAVFSLELTGGASQALIAFKLIDVIARLWRGAVLKLAQQATPAAIRVRHMRNALAELVRICAIVSLR